MSVLMKALAKAAEDRGKKPADAQAAGRELALESIDNPSGAGGGYTSSATRPTNSAAGGRSSAQINAATVLGARQPASYSVLAWMRTHPLYVFGMLAGCLLLLYAVYVYVQIAHPTWLMRAPPPPPPALATAPAQQEAAPAAGGPRAVGAAPASQAQAQSAPMVPMPSVFTPAGTTRAAPTAPAEAAEKLETRSAPRLEKPAVPRTGAVTPDAPDVRPQQPTVPQNRISVRHGDTAAPRVNPEVTEAYAALENGRFDTAQRLYGQALRRDPANIDALLGLAAIAQKDNRGEDAQRHYMAILEANPRHAMAQAGLIALMGRADPLAAESRLKQLLAREPSPPLYFNLGNLYADQGLWAQAQQAYFQAHNQDSSNPDYAFNLAVGLEHLGQQKLALGFYRKAQQLASARGAANFDTARIQDRITQLSSRFD